MNWTYAYLYFADEAAWNAVKAGLTPIHLSGLVLDEIGANIRAAAFGDSGVQTVPATTLPGWLVNVAHTAPLPAALAAAAITPVQPQRVFMEEEALNS